MIIQNLFLFLLLFSSSAPGCKKKDSLPDALPFAAKPVTTPLQPGIADEVSGMADSKANPGALWLQEDSGNPPELQLVDYKGKLLKKVFIKGIKNRDWEDMALAPGPDNALNYIYIADIGDNNAQYSNYAIYRFPEPTADTVFSPDKISFQYEDGSYDAESVLVDPLTKDIYIITKKGTAARVYKLPYPQSTTAVIRATFVTTLSFNGAVGAAFSANGKEIIIKNYGKLYYWTRSANEALQTTLQKTPVLLSYQQEPQGEAVCFKNDGSGFFTLSEKSFMPSVTLNYYKRL